MKENIRKIVDAAKESLQAADCRGIREPEPPPCPRYNVAKCVAKQRKTHQVTTH
jgi:hypothetical protein